MQRVANTLHGFQRVCYQWHCGVWGIEWRFICTVARASRFESMVAVESVGRALRGCVLVGVVLGVGFLASIV